MTRLFVAAWPSDEARAALGALPVPDEPGVRRVPPANWHVTLRFIGEASVDEVVGLLDGIRFPVTTAVLGPAVEQLDRRHVIVPVDGVDTLAAKVRRASMVVGERSERTFVGHLTIARLQPGAHTSLVGTPISTSFEVARIALVASELTSNGAVYSTVTTFAAS